MSKNELMKFLDEYKFECNHRKYRYNVYSRKILPLLEKFKDYIVNNGGMLQIPKGWLEYAVNNGSVPFTIEGWKKYVADNGSVLFMLDELEENIFDSDELPSMPKESRGFLVDNDMAVLMLDELKKYLIDNDMMMIMPEERQKYIEKVERRNKEPEQCTAQEIYEDTLAERRLSRTIIVVDFLDMLIQAESEYVSKNEEEEKLKALKIESWREARNAFQHNPTVSCS